MDNTVQKHEQLIGMPAINEKEDNSKNKMSDVVDDVVGEMVDVTSDVSSNETGPVPLEKIVIASDDVCQLKQNRLSATMEALGSEIFRADAIAEKKASFITKRPLEWIEALRGYVDTEHLNTRCELSTKKEKSKEKISIIKTRICFDGNKDVVVSVNCGTGVFRVHTLAISEWIKSEFPKIKSFLKPCNEPPTQAVTLHPMVSMENVFIWVSEGILISSFAGRS